MKFNEENNGKELTRRDENFGLLDPLWTDFFDFPRFNKPSNIMKTDIKENEKEYELQIEMPGYKKENVNIDLKDGYLVVSCEHKIENEQKDQNGKFIRRERSFGSASRSFYVGKDISEDEITASLENGVLKINLPKQKQVESKKRIEIK